MKKKNLITKKYFKSKKGFSLLELLCAVMIMAIAVSATAVGLNISNQSITKNSLMNKASAKAQMYCDIIMTYVEVTPSHDPSVSWNGWTEDYKSKNKLFINGSNYEFVDDIKTQISNDIKSLDTNITDVIQSTNISNKDIDATKVKYVIEKEGSYTTSENIDMVSYKITVYVDYGTNGRTSCTGVVTKTKYAQ